MRGLSSPPLSIRCPPPPHLIAVRVRYVQRRRAARRRRHRRRVGAAGGADLRRARRADGGCGGTPREPPVQGLQIRGACEGGGVQTWYREL